MINALEAGFDVCITRKSYLIESFSLCSQGFKMVSLAAAWAGLSDTAQCHKRDSSLRSCALWYPTVPKKAMNLNELSFTAKDTAITRCMPLCWTLFGGEMGSYLRPLTGMSVTGTGPIRSVIFHYNSSFTGNSAMKLQVGRCKPSEYDKTEYFAIDGQGGEMIADVEVYTRHFSDDDIMWQYKHGVLNSFNVSLSRPDTPFHVSYCC